MINVQFIRKLLTIRDRYSLLYEGSHSENYPKHEPLFRMTSNTSTPAVSKSATARSGVKLVAIAITAMIGAALSVLVLAEQGHVSRLTAEGAAPDEARRLLDRGHVNGRQIKLESALHGIAIPLHEGAERYYREIGLLK